MTAASRTAAIPGYSHMLEATLGGGGSMTLKVLTLNVWNDDGPWKSRVGRIREWIERLDPDVIGFQEILVKGDYDQSAEILAGMAYRRDFAKASDFWKDRSTAFGNAVASRWPITDREQIALPTGGTDETRSALSVTIDAPFGPLSFTCTHLNWKFHHGFVREEQVQAVADLVLRRRPRGGFPPILVGDFNADPDSTEIRFVKGLHALGGRSTYMLDCWQFGGDGGPGTTWSNANRYARSALEPDRRIDYVFAGYPQRDGIGMLESCRVVCDDEQDGVWPSDHYGVFATFTTTPQEEA